MIDIDKEVKDTLFNLGVEGNEYGDLVEYISKLLAEVKRLRKRNEWLEEVVGLAQEHWGIDLSDHREWPQWREEE